MSIHKALVLETKQGQQVVKDVPTPIPKSVEVLIRVESAALNPVDHAIAHDGIFVENFPTVLGIDGAGVIEAVGDSVERYRPGDRVFFKSDIGDPSSSTFQQKVIVPADLIGKIPDNWSFDEAATLPLATLTAAVGLFDVLKVPFPKDGTTSSEAGWILVTGGSGSVGQLTIQLAKLSGLKVITTSSPHNFPLLKSLGADITIDRSSPSYVDQIRSHTNDTLTHAFDASGKEAILAARSLSSSAPSKLVLVLPPPNELVDLRKEKIFENVTILAGGYDEHQRPLAARVWRLLEGLVGQGKVKPNQVKVLEGGLAGVLEGQKLQREGKVSGFKYVVRPQDTK
ncbi:hypothetical protein HK097_009294 [Rhizophlyctis rosea]|uniref:Enoyl reductase (ER) domain-containing protein n=1 Tax=Rhizophlyctis rosea TaxID=64517 RepID=A0AAD5SBI2_9FUNG|nr:hypothetical protein HK097_009294 [Rhizophlyctis rosea]